MYARIIPGHRISN